MNKKPTALKILEGTARPDRMNPDEPMLPAIGQIPAPDDLTPGQAAAWKYNLRYLARLRTATEADIPALRLLASELADLWAMERGEIDSDPTKRSALRKQLLNAYGRFGMTPVDRSRVSALQEKKKGDPLDEFG